MLRRDLFSYLGLKLTQSSYAHTECKKQRFLLLFFSHVFIYLWQFDFHFVLETLFMVLFKQQQAIAVVLCIFCRPLCLFSVTTNRYKRTHNGWLLTQGTNNKWWRGYSVGHTTTIQQGHHKNKSRCVRWPPPRFQIFPTSWLWRSSQAQNSALWSPDVADAAPVRLFFER